MLSVKAHWENAPVNCAYRQNVENRYVSSLLDQVDGDVRRLQNLYIDARTQPNSQFRELDLNATRDATAGLMLGEKARAAFRLEIFNLGG